MRKQVFVVVVLSDVYWRRIKINDFSGKMSFRASEIIITAEFSKLFE